MQTTLNFLAIRLNGKVIDTVAIVDDYTIVQFLIRNEVLNKDVDTIQALSSTKNWLLDIAKNGFYFKENEAKDVMGVYGNLSIQKETITVDVV